MDHVHGTYDFALVAFSYIVAIVASYTVLDLVGRISSSTRRTRWLWLSFGAFAMAMGVWSMHFIGMLAFSLHVPVAYDLITVVESYLAVLAGSLLSLLVVGRERLDLRHLLGGGFLLAAGIIAMHYLGMDAMQIDISYNPYYVILSVVIAIAAAITAFWLSFYFRKGNDRGKLWKKLVSGVVMGAAVVGMHYTGMFAADFHLGDRFGSTIGIVLDQKRLAYFIAGGTLLTLGLSILGIYISNRFSSKDSEMLTGFTWYKSLFDNNQDGIIAVDLEYRITGFNPAIAEMTGLMGTLPINQSINEILPFIAEEERDRTRERLRRAFLGELQNYETAIVRRDGKRIELHGINVPVVIDGQVVGSYIIARDITAEKSYKNMIQHQAYHDELTGLPNRRMFNQLLSDKIEGKPEKFTVMVMDIDRFKMINDSLGHMYGDQFLQEMSRRIKDCIAEMDVTAARMGGDEFTLLCDGCYGQDELEGLANRIIRAISHPYRLKDNDFYVTASIGIAVYPGDGSDAVQLLRNADTAMYEVKKNGKNGFQFYSSDLNKQLQEKIELEGYLRKALSYDEFFLRYQPQVNAENNKLIGVEALVRWQHPIRGVISPGVFIPIAEETGIIYELGSWVLREACRQMKAWHRAGGPLIPISVNLSSQQFHQANLSEFIRSVLEETGLEPEYLELEITESMMTDPSMSTSILNELSDSGIRLSLDDFGTGYSSLSYLKLLPIHQLKIDRSFIKDINNNPNDKAIVATIVSMARHLNMDVIAEGIETKEQLDILMENDCQKMQGYYYSKPLPAAELEAIFLVPNQQQA